MDKRHDGPRPAGVGAGTEQSGLRALPSAWSKKAVQDAGDDDLDSWRRPRLAPAPISSVIVGDSAAVRKLREKIHMCADDLSPVVVLGETGSGKELVARELHRHGRRAEKAFIPLNAGAVPKALAASELFGHAKGSFTGATVQRDGALIAADGGTLFLDEIGDMDPEIQAYLLRALDDGLVARVGSRAPVKSDFRLITATNVDLVEAVRQGKFRRDLYYRITVLLIDVPPLRERGDDVIAIAEDFIRTHPNMTYRAARLMPRAADRLKKHSYPGNVRELRNVVARALLHARANHDILPEHIHFLDDEPSETATFDIAAARDMVTRLLVLRAIDRTNGNVTRAAELLGRGRGAVHEILKEAGADPAQEYQRVRRQIRALAEG